MDPRDSLPTEQIDSLNAVFRDGLVACLEECAHGRRGLFVAYDHLAPDGEMADQPSWPEAARLRELAAALQSIYAQAGGRNTLCDEFLDLCTIHGEYDPGESRLARTFLARIEGDE
jgi:hypothetical protein